MMITELQTRSIEETFYYINPLGKILHYEFSFRKSQLGKIETLSNRNLLKTLWRHSQKYKITAFTRDKMNFGNLHTDTILFKTTFRCAQLLL